MLFLYFLIWIFLGIISISIFDKIDGYTTDWKSYLVGAISGPTGLVVISIYIIMFASIKIYDTICNKVKGIR